MIFLSVIVVVQTILSIDYATSESTYECKYPKGIRGSSFKSKEPGYS